MTVLSATLFCFTTALVSQAPAAPRVELTGATPGPIGTHALFELTLRVEARYANPFDPADIDVWAEFSPPAGAPLRVNAFYDQPFRREMTDNRETIVPDGEPLWRVRFSPPLPGTWRARVFARNAAGAASTEPCSFEAVPSGDPGPVRVSPQAPRHFALADGSPFFPVGENLCWAGPRGLADYDDWLTALGAARANWVRVWMCSWNCALEWRADPDTPPDRPDAFHGAGRYHLANAWKLDQILDLAARQGIRVMLCLGTFGEFTTGGYFNEGQWDQNPYNVANGGPCATPADFWSNPGARALYQRRLRYLAARYAWRPNLFAWEFWNEAKAPADWVREMACYLKGAEPFDGKPADPFNHLVSTTYGDPDVWSIPQIDFTMTHHYGQGDIADSAPVIYGDARAAVTAPLAKPHLMAEFGIDWRSSDDPYDPRRAGVNLHNGLWASACSGNAGGAMLWYWDSYVHPAGLYGHFAALRRFADAIPWNSGPWAPLDLDPPRVPGAPDTYRDLSVTPARDWGRKADSPLAIVTTEAPDSGLFPSYVYGPAQPDLRAPVEFDVNYERPGRLLVAVAMVSDRALLRFTVDGDAPHDFPLSARPPEDPAVPPEYVKTELKPEWNIYQAEFDRSWGIDVPAGAHRIRLEIAEGDWVKVAAYVLQGYVSARIANLHAYGITNGADAILWLHNAGYHWKSVRDGSAVPPVTGATTVIRGLRPGDCTIEWWDTCEGAVTARTPATITADGLTLDLPDIARDMAIRIVPGAPRDHR